MLTILILLPVLCFGTETELPPFEYDLHLHTIPGKSDRMIICFHGYKGNYQIAHTLKESAVTDATLVSFNFPDHDIDEKKADPNKIALGTFHEILPAFYVLKKYVVDKKYDSIDVYGFSAGGAVAVNLLAALNGSNHDHELKKIGVGVEEKKSILRAIENGVVILDTPLKSIDEIIDIRGFDPGMAFVAKLYRDNNLRPIDSLHQLSGLKLNIILNFQKADEIICNRDDTLYIERLKKANHMGNTTVIIDQHGGHSAIHRSLWKAYSEHTAARREAWNIEAVR